MLSYGAETDTALAACVRNGDREAFGVLYDRHCPDLLRYLRGRTGDVDLSEDLCSETFVRAFKGINGFGGGNFGAWLTRIARNLMLDHHKSARTRCEVQVRDVWGPGDAVASPETLVLEQLDRIEARSAVVSALEELSPDQLTCIRLRFYDDHTVADTALVMARTEGAVKVLQHRAVRRLGHALITRSTARA